MNLVTVSSPKFYPNAKALVSSFHAIYPNGRSLVYWFGGNAPDIPGSEIYPVLKDCPHAHNPGYFYFKAYALDDGYHKINDDMIYVDSRHRFIRRPLEIERRLITTGRFYVKYPEMDVYKIKVHTTSVCLGVLGYNKDDKIGDKHLYWAAIQAYRTGKENEKLISELRSIMKNPLAAGPANTAVRPDGPNGCCAHRNDQSVLSILIEKYGLGQSYNQIVSNNYGDRETIESLGGPEHKWNHAIKGRINI